MEDFVREPHPVPRRSQLNRFYCHEFGSRLMATTAVLLCLAVSSPASRAPVVNADPKLKSVQFVTPPDESPVTVKLSIDGQGFGTDPKAVTVQFTTTQPSRSLTPKIDSVTDTEILLEVQAATGTEIKNTTLSIGGKKAASSQELALPSGSASSAVNPPKSPAPKFRIDSIKVVGTPANAVITFKLAIDGENFGTDKAAVTVQFTTKDASQPVKATVDSVTQTEIITSVESAANTDISKITVTVGNKSVSSAEGLSISIKPNPPAPPATLPASFQIKLDHETNTQFPNLHTLVVTKTGGEGGFGNRDKRIALDLVPAGTEALKIDQISDDALHLSFVAAADYVPKSLSVTVYDSSDLETRNPSAVGTVDPASTKTDVNEPKITQVETVFLDRSQGKGRIRIYGSGFGDYDPPAAGMPFLTDDYLRCDVERPNFSAPPSPITSESDLAARDAERQKKVRDSDPDCKSFDTKYKANFDEWSAYVRSKIEIGIRSREEGLEVERTAVLYIDDKLVDIYFEFNRLRGYSEPFRLENATLSIRKSVVTTTQTTKSQTHTGQVNSPVETAYALSQTVGAQPNPNLTYSYTILDRRSAKTLFGSGVARNFYVIKVSIVNNGKNKVSVPLASVQAEAEWARGKDDRRGDVVDYLEGPELVSPVPLAAVTAYFSADYKVTGKRARFFNILTGITTLSAAAVPFAGPSFQVGNAVFTAGFVPGLRTVIGDLSDQQLQTLAGQSWQSSETIAANGGSVDKFVYIQRSEQFADEAVEFNYRDGDTYHKYKKVTKKKLTNLMGMEITGTEIQEATGTAATPASTPQTKPNSSTKPETSSPTTPAPPKTGKSGGQKAKG